jgi:hypothetical protein
MINHIVTKGVLKSVCLIPYWWRARWPDEQAMQNNKLSDLVWIPKEKKSLSRTNLVVDVWIHIL